MRPLSWLLSLGLLVVGLLMAGLPTAAEDAPPGSVEIEAAFKWLETLDLPNVRGYKYVRVRGERIRPAARRYPWNNEDEHLTRGVVEGFLLRENDASFTLYTDFLDTLTFEKPVADKPNDNRFTYELLDLEQHATSRRDELVKHLENPREMEPQPLRKPEYFLLARGCRQHGFEAVAQSLAQHAATLPKNLIVRVETLSEDLADHLRWGMIRRTREEFQFASISRGELLAKFEWIDKHLHYDGFDEYVNEPIRRLKKMIAEDDAHAKLASQPLAKLPVEGRVRELIFRLRDQDGRPHSKEFSLGSVVSADATLSPMDDLLAIGPEAVPQLIEAIDDSRYTRWVCYGDLRTSTSRGTIEIYPIGLCACIVIDAIAGEDARFPNEGYNTNTPEDAAQAKQALRDWWAKLQSKNKQ